MITISIYAFKRSYKLVFQKDNALTEAIKALPVRIFDKTDEIWGWVLPSPSLFTLMKQFKGNANYSWAFATDKLKDSFVKQAHVEAAKRAKLDSEAGDRAQAKSDLVTYKEWLKAADTLDYPFESHLKPGIKLFRHQQEATQWLVKAKSGILAAEMGLGKSLMFTLAVEMDSSIKKALIICPNSLKYTLQDEIAKFLHSKAYILNKKPKKQPPIAECKFLIVNYEYFNRAEFDAKAKLKAFGAHDVDIVICDESHRLKNKSSNTLINIKKNFKGKRFIMSTGTPIKSFSKELFTQLNLIAPHEFSNQDTFQKEYCGMVWDSYFSQWKFDYRAERLQELYDKTAPIMYRIRKQDALDLPEKIYSKISIEMSDEEWREYRAIEQKTIEELPTEDGEGATYKSILTVTTMMRLREYISKIKARYLKEILERQMEEGYKIVFLDFFKDSLKELHAMFPETSDIHEGEMSVENRDIMKKRFMADNNDLMLFLGTSSTCKEGLTLTASSNLYLNTLEWTVADCDQLFDRIHRIGQKHTCNIYLPVIKDTIDDYVYEALQTKRVTFSKLIDNEDHVDTTGESVLADVMGKWLAERKITS